jgi:hypothetical protein
MGDVRLWGGGGERRTAGSRYTASLKSVLVRGMSRCGGGGEGQRYTASLKSVLVCQHVAKGEETEVLAVAKSRVPGFEGNMGI